MDRNDIRINLATMHVLDTISNTCIISESPISHGSNFADFLKNHIYRFFSKDDVKECEFKSDAKFQTRFTDYKSEDFLSLSRDLASSLYQIMQRNIDIPPADLFVVECTIDQEKWIAILKVNYKTLYGHIAENNIVDIALHNNLIPAGNAQLTEAAVINTNTGKLRVVEKKYDVNGVKTNYFSSIFLQCRHEISDKAKLSIVKRSINNIVDKYFDEDDVEKDIQIKAAIAEKYEETGEYNISTIAEDIFPENYELQNELNEKFDKYGIRNAKVAPVTDTVKKSLCTQEIITETGIRIIIPLDEYQNKDNISFSALNGGSITIKNIGAIKKK